MTKKKKKAAGYIRVSSAHQIDNESLTTQRTAIEEECEKEKYHLTEIYADEGISGGTVEERDDLKRALKDAKAGKFDILIIRDLSRFGRNARELFNNHKELEDHGIELCFIKEKIDTSTEMGKLMFQLLSILAEFELKMIRERMLDNRVAKALRGIPTSGALPFGRTFDYKKEKWGVDEEAKRLIKWAAEEYLKGESLRELAHILRTRHNQPLGYNNLIKVLTERSGDSWIINFEDEIPITYTIPRLLKDETIQRVKDRIDHNRNDPRHDVRSYLLTGFIRCDKCKKSLSGQKMVSDDKEYWYYRHPGGKREPCKTFHSIKLKQIERAVFKTIFENIHDVPTFNRAIKDSLPDQQQIDDLNQKIKKGKKDLERVENDLQKLVAALLDETMDKATIKNTREKLQETQEQIKNEIDEAQNRLDNLPNPEEVKKEAEEIRKELMRKYQSKAHLQNMTFKDKKMLLHFLFDGKAPNGNNYGIYVDKRGRGKSAEIDYFMFGKITGLRTIKGDDIDWHPDDDNGGNVDSGGGQDLPQPAIKKKDRADIGKDIPWTPDDEKSDPTHRKSNFKTNLSALLPRNQQEFKPGVSLPVGED